VADKLQRALVNDAGLVESGGAIHSRVLGDIIYFMTSLAVRPDTVVGLQDRLLSTIEKTYP
jgi:hypothetical protein